MKKVPTCTWVWVAAIALMPTATARADSTHVWEKVEIKLQAQRQYDNPYTDVKVWVDLKGPEFERRCYGFWDGGHTFRVRVSCHVFLRCLCHLGHDLTVRRGGLWLQPLHATLAPATLIRSLPDHSPPWRLNYEELPLRKTAGLEATYTLPQ